MKTSTHDAARQPNEQASRQTARFDAQPQNQSETEARVHELVRALGEPGHPLHGQAVNELVDIGAPAVPSLSAALASTYPWLTSFRAAEALAQIGDGRASGSLINALRHPNSNVRWSAVRALAEIGDGRTLLALRRVAREDRSKTSWGESVADTAQLALDRLQSESALLRFSEPIKTAVLLIVMVAVLVFAYNRVQGLRDLLADPQAAATLPGAEAAEANSGDTEAGTDEPPAEGEAAEGDAGENAAEGEAAEGDAGENAAEGEAAEGEAAPAEPPPPTPEPTPEPTPTPEPVIGTARVNGNLRSGPSTDSQIIGGVTPGDQLYFLEQQGDWYRIRLGPNAPGASLQGEEGWVASVVVNPPSAPVPAAP